MSARWSEGQVRSKGVKGSMFMGGKRVKADVSGVYVYKGGSLLKGMNV